MHVDRIVVGLMVAGFVATISGCTRRAAEPASVPEQAAQSPSNPPVGGSGDTPVATADKEAKVQDPPRQAGIGTALKIEDGTVFVTHVLPDTPAARSNLIKPNDQIVAVAEGNEEPIDVTGTEKIARVVGMIRGPIGTVVRLTIVPEGRDETDRLVVSLTRGTIKEIDSWVDGRLLPIGAKAPNFKFAPLDDAEQTDLSQLSGRIVVIEFWASWCGPCIKALNELESLHAQHPEWTGQVEFLAVSVDERKEDAVTVFNRTHWSKFSTVWAGPDVLRLYRISGLPTVFVIDRDGNVAAVGIFLDVPAALKPLLQRSKE